jgi:hypothetical protein
VAAVDDVHLICRHLVPGDLQNYPGTILHHNKHLLANRYGYIRYRLGKAVIGRRVRIQRNNSCVPCQADQRRRYISPVATTSPMHCKNSPCNVHRASSLASKAPSIEIIGEKHHTYTHKPEVHETFVTANSDPATWDGEPGWPITLQPLDSAPRATFRDWSTPDMCSLLLHVVDPSVLRHKGMVGVYKNSRLVEPLIVDFNV